MSDETNPPAFPRPHSRDEIGAVRYGAHSGMSLRDYFAAAALQGYLASPITAQRFDYEATAVSAYKFADAMLEARKSGGGTK